MPPSSLRIVVPGTPIGKKRPRVDSRGKRPRVFTPTETERYEKLIRAAGERACAEWMRENREAWSTVGEFVMVVHAYSDAHTLPDGDNVWKSCADALNRVVWLDDRFVGGAFAPVRRDSGAPRTEILIWRAWDPSVTKLVDLTLLATLLDAAATLLAASRRRLPTITPIMRMKAAFDAFLRFDEEDPS